MKKTKFKLIKVLLYCLIVLMMVQCTKEDHSNLNNSSSLNGTTWIDGRDVTLSFQANTAWLSKEYGATKYKYSYQYNAPNLTLHPISVEGWPDLTGTVENDIMYVYNPTITYGSTLIYTLYKE